MHLDVMDGLFVPQLTYGLVVVEAVRRAATVPIEVHMMVERPDDTAIQYAKAGADISKIEHIKLRTYLKNTKNFILVKFNICFILGQDNNYLRGYLK